MAEPITTNSAWLAAHPPAAERLPETLAGVSERVRAGEEFGFAIREFLDEFALRGDDEARAEAITVPPAPTGDRRYDAYLGALAEHLAAAHDLERAGVVDRALAIPRPLLVRQLGARLPRHLDRPGPCCLSAPRHLRPRALAAAGLSRGRIERRGRCSTCPAGAVSSPPRACCWRSIPLLASSSKSSSAASRDPRSRAARSPFERATSDASPIASRFMRLSVVMPAQNEEGSVGATVEGLVSTLEEAEIDYEIVVVNDDSEDRTEAVIAAIGAANPRVRVHKSHYERGFGSAIRAGLDVFEGDAVAIVMADASDDPRDLVRYAHLLEEGWDCAFGSRFMPGAEIHDYPALKLFINRLANQFIRLLFRHRYNDTTNAFKAYRREVIDTVQPLLSKHFNLTVELPLKAVVRGHSFAVVPTSWTNRTSGEAKLKMKEMGSRYLFIVLYVWLEKVLSRGDYQIREPQTGRAPAPRA